ncbi:uncharacterized protein [Ranitomeya imitator]|uniref:uncharacterized protein n=1 Tax=Ranitomeya imitator TaxID=111125 RepID=UPI0037E8B864
MGPRKPRNTQQPAVDQPAQRTALDTFLGLEQVQGDTQAPSLQRQVGEEGVSWRDTLHQDSIQEADGCGEEEEISPSTSGEEPCTEGAELHGDQTSTAADSSHEVRGRRDVGPPFLHPSYQLTQTNSSSSHQEAHGRNITQDTAYNQPHQGHYSSHHPHSSVNYPPNSQPVGSFRGPPPPSQDWQSILASLPSKEDFKILISEVKDICRAEIANVRQDLQHLNGRIEALEEEHDSTRKHMTEIHQLVSSQQKVMEEMQSHLEDLDNRGRRCNIRVKGVPEVEDSESPDLILQDIFNNILGAPSTNITKLDRAHRALQPKNMSTQPRDIICCVHDFTTKELIMSKARTRNQIPSFRGTEVQLFPDLSRITLQKRRHLRPLLLILQEHQIKYRWGFPFALTARKDGKSASLRTPADVTSFCTTLEIPAVDIPPWVLHVPGAPPPPVWSKMGRGRRGARGGGGGRGGCAPSSPRAR